MVLYKAAGALFMGLLGLEALRVARGCRSQEDSQYGERRRGQRLGGGGRWLWEGVGCEA